MYEYSCQITRVVDGDTVDVILDQTYPPSTEADQGCA
jgi:endonuclease YncB( thermonuclease family)